MVLGLRFISFAVTQGKYAANVSSDNAIMPFVPWFAFLGAVFAIAYGVGISGGLAESQVALGIGAIIALLVLVLKDTSWWGIAVAIIIGYSMFFSLSAASRKYVQTYSWWGLAEESVWEAEYESDVPLLKGIKMNRLDRDAYNGVVKIIQENSTEEDTIFCFPHIPIFYALSDRSSATYTQVQWFDMSSMSDIQKDIETLQENPPKVIVQCKMPESTFAGHENAFNAGRVSQTRLMERFLTDFASENNYTLQGGFELGNGYSILVFVQEAEQDQVKQVDYQQYFNSSYAQWKTVFEEYNIVPENTKVFATDSTKQDWADSMGIPENMCDLQISNAAELYRKLLRGEQSDTLFIEIPLYRSLISAYGKDAIDVLQDYNVVLSTDAFAILQNNVSGEDVKNENVVSWFGVFGLYETETFEDGAIAENENGIFLNRLMGNEGTLNWYQSNAKVNIQNDAIDSRTVTVSFDIMHMEENINEANTLKLYMDGAEETIPLGRWNQPDGSQHIEFVCTLQPGENGLYFTVDNEPLQSETTRKLHISIMNFNVE